jgi:hypothetical protein
MHFDERVLVDVAFRLLQFYKLETGRDGALDEATRWFAARLFASLDRKEKARFLDTFLNGKTADGQVEALKWLFGLQDFAISKIPN